METLIKRPSLNRRLVYRPHVKAIYFLVGIAIILIGFASVFFYLSSSLISDELQTRDRMFLYFNALLAFNLVVCLIVLRKMLSTEFHVYPDRVEIFKSGQTTTLSFENVAEVRFSHIPFFTSFCTITMKDKTKHVFHMAIERSEYVFSALYAFNAELFDVQKLSKYRKSAIITDHAARRMEARARNWKELTLKYFLYPTALFGVYNLLNGFGLNSQSGLSLYSYWILFILAHASLGIAIYLACEFVLIQREKRKLIKDPNDLWVDIKNEDLWKVNSHWAFLGISLLTCLTLILI